MRAEKLPEPAACQTHCEGLYSAEVTATGVVRVSVIRYPAGVREQAWTTHGIRVAWIYGGLVVQAIPILSACPPATHRGCGLARPRFLAPHVQVRTRRNRHRGCARGTGRTGSMDRNRDLSLATLQCHVPKDPLCECWPPMSHGGYDSASGRPLEAKHLAR